MRKNNSLKLVELMSCAIALGVPMITDGIVNADTNSAQSSSISQNETKFVFNPNDSLTKQALNKVHQGTIKDVILVTVKDGKECDTPMTKQSDGSYTATLKESSKDTKYQYKVDFQDGKSVTINDPHLDNSTNDQYSVIGDKSATSKTNITITTPDGTVIDINGNYNKESSSNNESSVAKVSIVSSSKLDSSQLSEKNETTLKSNSKNNDSSEKNESKSSELLKSSESVDKSSSSTLASSLKENNSKNNKETMMVSSENRANNQAAVVTNGQKEIGDSKENGSQTPDVITSPETNKGNNDQETNNQPAKTQAAVTDKNNSKSESQSSSSLSSSSQSSSSDESSVAGNDNTQSMPQTGEMIIRGLSILGITLLVGVGGYYGFQNYKNRKNTK